MAPVAPHGKPATLDIQDKYVRGKKCEACPDTPCKILSDRFKVKHRDAQRTQEHSWYHMGEMMKELRAACLKLVVSGPGSHPKPSHHPATLGKASATQAAALHQQILAALPTPLGTAFAHTG